MDPLIRRHPDRVTTVVNKEFARGMSTSIRAGLNALSKEYEGVLVALADEPFVSPKVIDALISAYRAGRGNILVPTFQGGKGHPVLFDRKYFPELEALKGDVGARSVVQAHKQELASLEVDEPGVLLDVDDIETYQRLTEKEKKRS
jgi:molybdenum cofactor cytidylyltransferase